MKRTSPRQVAALVRVMRTVVARFAPPKLVTDVLDRTEKGTAREADVKAVQELRTDDRAAMWAFNAVATLAWMAVKGEEHGEDVLAHAGYAGAEVDALYAKALAEVAALPDQPIAAKKRDTRGLAAVRKTLGPRLDRIGAERDPVVPRAQLERLLAKKKYVAHAAVIAFERDFGGLRWPSDDGDGDTIVGAFACLSSDAHVAPRGGPGQAALALVPIVYGPPDNALFLDARGRVYAQDLVADVDATLYARTGRAALRKLLG